MGYLEDEQQDRRERELARAAAYAKVVADFARAPGGDPTKDGPKYQEAVRVAHRQMLIRAPHWRALRHASQYVGMSPATLLREFKRYRLRVPRLNPPSRD